MWMIPWPPPRRSTLYRTVERCMPTTDFPAMRTAGSAMSTAGWSSPWQTAVKRRSFPVRVQGLQCIPWFRRLPTILKNSTVKLMISCTCWPIRTARRIPSVLPEPPLKNWWLTDSSRPIRKLSSSPISPVSHRRNLLRHFQWCWWRGLTSDGLCLPLR